MCFFSVADEQKTQTCFPLLRRYVEMIDLLHDFIVKAVQLGVF